ncbi:hypothetical protein GOP47_0030138 [Adiantum capillus-veneris]|nr:hypothetical protein GOP47_0030138 [Adiantum capillus-veneris]
MSVVPASSHLEIKSFYAVRDSLAFHDACSIRYNVFVAEQGFSADIEFDKIDETCVHLLAYYVSPVWGGRSVPVGTLRIHPLPNSTVGKISRVAIMKPHRHQGIARRLVSVAESVAQTMALTRCILHAQADKRIVYEKFGYRVMDIEHTELQNGSEDIVNLDEIGGTDAEGRRGQFLEDGVWHVKMYKDILQTP